MKEEVRVAVSGGFDPVHIGHLRMMQEARKLGDHLIIILNNNNWLNLKKGFVFMDEKERKEILLGFSCVDEVVVSYHEQGTTDLSVCNELRKIRPDIFANGGDRKADNIPEYQVCEELNIKMKFNVGRGGKVQSSSDLVQEAKKHQQ